MTDRDKLFNNLIWNYFPEMVRLKSYLTEFKNSFFFYLQYQDLHERFSN